MANEKQKATRPTSTVNDGHGNTEFDVAEMLRLRQEAIETATRLEAVADRIGKAATTEAYPPPEVAYKVEAVSVTKGT